MIIKRFIGFIAFIIIFNVLKAQSITEDLRQGIYMKDGDWITVQQLKGDTLYNTKLPESDYHLKRIGHLLPDSIFLKTFTAIDRNRVRYSILNKFEYLDSNHLVLIFIKDKELGLFHIVKKELNYDLYVKTFIIKNNFEVQKKLQDTIHYFSYLTFSYEQLEKIKNYKNPKLLTKAENKKVELLMVKEAKKYKQFEKTKNVGALEAQAIGNVLEAKVWFLMGYHPFKSPEFNRKYK